MYSVVLRKVCIVRVLDRIFRGRKCNTKSCTFVCDFFLFYFFNLNTFECLPCPHPHPTPHVFWGARGVGCKVVGVYLGVTKS